MGIGDLGLVGLEVYRLGSREYEDRDIREPTHLTLKCLRSRIFKKIETLCLILSFSLI